MWALVQGWRYQILPNMGNSTFRISENLSNPTEGCSARVCGARASLSGYLKRFYGLFFLFFFTVPIFFDRKISVKIRILKISLYYAFVSVSKVQMCRVRVFTDIFRSKKIGTMQKIKKVNRRISLTIQKAELWHPKPLRNTPQSDY